MVDCWAIGGRRSRAGTAFDVRLGRELDPAERSLLDQAIERYRRFTDG
jgi:hypothetical protein